MVLEVEEFIERLAKDNEAYFSSLPETDTVYWLCPVALQFEGESGPLRGREAVAALLPRWYNEVRGAEIIGRFVGRVPDLTLKVLVGRQVGDEAKHAHYCRKRIEALGGSVLDFQPSIEQVEFGDFLDSLAYPEEFFAAQQFTIETQSIKRNELALQRFDSKTAQMFKDHVNPDERFHARLGALGLKVFARTQPAQDRAWRAAVMAREAHVRMVRSHSRNNLAAPTSMGFEGGK